MLFGGDPFSTDRFRPDGLKENLPIFEKHRMAQPCHLVATMRH